MKNKNSSQYLDYELEYDYESDTIFFKRMTFSDAPDEPYIYPEGFCYEHITKDIAFKFQMVEDYAQKETLPKREYTMEDWQCQLCRWQKPCYEKYAQEFQELKTDLVISDTVMLRNNYGEFFINDFITEYKQRKSKEAALKKANEDDKKALSWLGTRKKAQYSRKNSKQMDE